MDDTDPAQLVMTTLLHIRDTAGTDAACLAAERMICAATAVLACEYGMDGTIEVASIAVRAADIAVSERRAA